MLSNCGAGEDSWESLGQQGDQTSQSKEHQSWISIESTDAEAPTFWSPDAEVTYWKRRWAGKDWWQEEKGMTEDEMVG